MKKLVLCTLVSLMFLNNTFANQPPMNYMLQGPSPMDAFFGGIANYQTMQNNDLLNKKLQLENERLELQNKQLRMQSLVQSMPFVNNNYTCSQFMYEHGLATSAQINCDFNKYNDRAITQASQCYALAESVGKKRDMEDVFKTGLDDFQNQYTKASNKKHICNKVLESFPLFLSN